MSWDLGSKQTLYIENGNCFVQCFENFYIDYQEINLFH